MIIDLSVRVKKKIREKRARRRMLLPSHGVVDFISTSKLSEAGNLANLIYFLHLVSPSEHIQQCSRQHGVKFAVQVDKIQRMHVF